jgi:uncharacterized membrane protein YkoI
MVKIEEVEVVTGVVSAEAPAVSAGAPLLEFNLRHPDGTRWEATCNADSGELVELERVLDSSQDSLFRTRAKVTESSARKTALAAYPGEVDDVEYELESDGSPIYEFSIEARSGAPGMRVEVDAVSGRIMEVRKEGYEVTTE